MNEENKRDEQVEENGELKKKKIKNLTSLVIILAGLLLGSIFVDVAQLVSGSGFSAKKLKQVDVFESQGKTWVAYSEPVVKVEVVSDEKCENCKPEENLLKLRQALPTLLTVKADENSEEGKKIISDFEIKALPAFVFSKEVEKTEFFSQYPMIFNKKGEKYVLKTTEIGWPADKYLELPKIGEGDAKSGPEDAKVKMVVFSDFQCPFCKNYHSVVEKVLKEYGNKIQFAFKNLPLDFHPQAGNAALAVQCANEQEKFFPYASKLFETQEVWGKTEGVQSFKNYALNLGIKAGQFNECLDSKKYQGKIDSDIEEAGNFGISGTPGTFINSQFKGGLISYEEIKKTIDEELAK